MTIHKGPCRECSRPMVAQHEWRRNPEIRPGRVRHAGYGRCDTCYTRGRRHGTLPSVTITGYYPVECDQCGLIATASRRDEARRVRAEHLAEHGAAPTQPSPGPLPAAEVARLRRMVGVA